MRTVTQTNPALPAGPKGRWLIGSLPMLRGDGLARIEGWAREYGGIFYCRALSIGFCLISKPDLIEDVLVTQSHNFIHGLALVSNRRIPSWPGARPRRVRPPRLQSRLCPALAPPGI